MKKILFVLFAFLTLSSVTANAQIQRYVAKQFAIARVINGNYDWTDWESSSVSITFNLSSDIITIYSQRTQTYRVLGTANNGQAYADNSGGRTIKFFVIDQDGDRGTVRLRVQSDGTSQIYVDFNDVAWCYGSVVRTY